MKRKEIVFNGNIIDNYCRPYIIAEIGSNHNGDIELAKKMIEKAKECGADAVKFQSWTPNTLIAKEEYDRNQKYNDSPKKHFGSLKEMVEKYYLRKEQHYELKDHCLKVGIDFCSSPFSCEEVDLLVDLNVPFIKVASMDINNPLLLKHIAKTNKPVVLSTGMANIAEIDQAIRWIKEEGNDQIVLLHCISIYPPKYEDINLNNIVMLKKTFNCPIGFSDHSIGTAIPLASCVLGACIIEKHFTLDKNMDGWDHEISANPEELKIICMESGNIIKSLGSFERIISEDEKIKIPKFRRSLVVVKDLPAGTIINKEMLTAKRPGTGIRPDEIEYVIGRTTKHNLVVDEVLYWNSLE